MQRLGLIGVGVIAFVLAVVAYSGTFVVNERQQALVLQFGAPQYDVQEPGLHFKIPFVQNVEFFDDRILDYDAAVQEIPTADQKQILVDAFARYKIEEPLQFFQSVRNEALGQNRLGSLITSSLRRVFGEVDLTKVLTDERSVLMRKIADQVNEEAASLGLTVVDVRIKRVDLPEENSQAIFRRMQTQREQEARRFRAEGQKENQFIRAEADKQARVIIAEARKQSEILRGEGEGQAEEIYRQSFGRDPEFFKFYRTMQAYRTGLAGESTRYVINPSDHEFFSFMGRRGPDVQSATGGSSSTNLGQLPQ